MKFTEHLIFLALMTPTVALLTAAVVSLTAPSPSLSLSGFDAAVIEYLHSESLVDLP